MSDFDDLVRALLVERYRPTPRGQSTDRRPEPGQAVADLARALEAERPPHTPIPPGGTR